MFNKIFSLILISTLSIQVYAKEKIKEGSLSDLIKKDGIEIYVTDSYGEEKELFIKKVNMDKCKDVKGSIPTNVWGGNYAKTDIPSECKKTYLTTMGRLNPIKMEGIETYGEIEVINFIKEAQTDDDLLLVDTRLSDWYNISTIPTAVNIPFPTFDPKSPIFDGTLMTLDVERDEDKYIFDNAKTVVLFCNGIWCPQSSWAIENLAKFGYPKDKLKWYRGGMYSWTSLDLTTIKP